DNHDPILVERRPAVAGRMVPVQPLDLLRDGILMINKVGYCRIRTSLMRMRVGVAPAGWRNRLKCSGRSPLIAMVKTSQLREFNNLPHTGPLNGPRLRGIFDEA